LGKLRAASRVHSQFVGDKYRFNATDFIRLGLPAKIHCGVLSTLFPGPLIQKKLWFMYSGTIRQTTAFSRNSRAVQ
jgi:hypothetical protein